MCWSTGSLRWSVQHEHQGLKVEGSPIMQMSLNTPEMLKTVDPFTLVLGIRLYEDTKGADIALLQVIGSKATLFWFVLYSDRPAQGQSLHQPAAVRAGIQQV